MQFIPPEIFAKFCTFLSPNDLFNLSQVCRKFRGYLYAPNSFSTQQIWKISRLQFMPKEDMPPPEGMSEEKYVRLLITERGCQICKKTKECKIYWEFEVRCCEKCFLKKTSSSLSQPLPSDPPSQPLPSDPPSHPLPSDPPSHPPPRKIARRLKNNNEEIDNNKVDILFKAIDVPLPLYVQFVKDIYAQYILLSSKSRESNPYYVSYLSFDSFLYSDYIPIITFQSIRGENENKEEKKSDRNRKRKIRDDFIKSEKKKSKGKFYKFNGNHLYIYKSSLLLQRLKTANELDTQVFV
ncbi:hypothetical protein RhiirA1_443777 [Rhizophagus irregularis]|uniref:Uncharacterized protein n=1 Tax=Rhizophagus irregularis TaxID=588596 RepID=A0A2I1EV28_9GLOM|nr:hypothetical protein RhiirA1_443777 [Rhizophagus irregularis]PKY25984.1 hypothetical protein RhiirB3_512471 [Rhizophagus irregularis]